MQRPQLLADRLREVLLSGHWVAHTNYRAQLERTTWQQATRQVGGLNTIALLTHHVQYYLAGLCQVQEGGPLEIRDKHSFTMPPVRDAADWQQRITAFLTHAERFIHLVEQLPDAQLDQPFVAPQYGTWQRNLESVVEHAYYHLGQVVLVHKLVEHEPGV